MTEPYVIGEAERALLIRLAALPVGSWSDILESLTMEQLWQLNMAGLIGLDFDGPDDDGPPIARITRKGREVLS